MKTKLSIPIETVYLLPNDREYSEAEAMIQIIYDIETQSEWSTLGYANQFQWSRTKVETFLSKRIDRKKLERHRKITNSNTLSKIKDISQRKKNFGKLLVPHLDKYGKKMVREFFDYWTESGNGKMRFEDQKYFDIPRRFVTWSKFAKKNEEYGVEEKKLTEDMKSKESQDMFKKVYGDLKINVK